MMTDKISVLIVDDNRTNLALMDMLLRKLPNCTTRLLTDPEPLLDADGDLDYDLAVIAWRLPQISGIDLARRLKAHPQLRDKPILIAADESDPGLRARAREAGIADVLPKPIDPVQFRARIQTLWRTGGRPGPVPRHTETGWDDHAFDASGTSLREESFLPVIMRVANYLDCESPFHGPRVGRYCAIMAHNLGLPEEFCREIRLAAPLHDVGRAGLPDALRRSTGVLSPEERKAMEEHTRIGYAMLSESHAPLFRMAAEIALTHHERWDGSGYPRRLRGEQIPLAGRIAAVADVFDALTSMRSYKSAWAIGNAFNYLKENGGVLFDPACVAALESGRDEVTTVMRAMPDIEDGSSSDDDADAA